MDPTPRLPDGAASARGSDLAIGPTGADHEAARRLCGRSLMVARGAWLGVVALTLGLAIPGFVIAFDRPELLQQPELLGLADRLGLPNRVLMAAGLLVPMAAVSAIAIFLFWRRSDDWMAMLFSLQLITSIAFTTRSLSVLEHAYPAVRAPVRFIWLLGIVLSIVTLYLFPDGRFVPRSTHPPARHRRGRARGALARPARRHAAPASRPGGDGCLALGGGGPGFAHSLGHRVGCPDLSVPARLRAGRA